MGLEGEKDSQEESAILPRAEPSVLSRAEEPQAIRVEC